MMGRGKGRMEQRGCDLTRCDSHFQPWNREIVSPGDGKNFPQPTNTVVVHYTGRVSLRCYHLPVCPALTCAFCHRCQLEDGSKFDSSVDRKMPFQFQLGTGQVITGWDEAIKNVSPLLH